MGTDTPISALSDKPKLLYTYFKQNFAQVTNPPIDPIREELVMSLVSMIGPRPNLFDLEGTSATSGWKCASRSSPTRTSRRSARSPRSATPFRHRTLDITWPAEQGRGAGGGARRLCAAPNGGAHGYNILILSDRAPAPSASRSRRCSPPRRCTIT